MSWKLSKPLARPTRIRRQPVRPKFCPVLEVLETRQLLSNVLTYHNDLGRTGQNLTETTLTPGNVYAGSFGKLFAYPVDGQVYAQPLYMAGVTLPDGSTHDIVYVATEHDSVYALDADDPTSGPNGDGVLWQTSFIDPANGIFPFSQADAFGCSQITPEIGITSTPVIDPGSGLMYVVSQTKVVADGTTYHQTLHALDITTGSEVLGPVDIQASVVNDSGQTVVFDPRYYKERAALTLVNGVLYTAWASHCDITPSHGWVIGYDAQTLSQVSVFNTSPNGNLDTIWQGDGGLAVDPAGNLYFETGNGTDITGYGDDYSEAFIRLNGGDGRTVDDYFIPYNYHMLDQLDRDLGSGAPIVLPDQPGDHPHLLVGAGKEGKIYLIDRDNMGGLNNPPFGPDLVVQSIPNALAGGSWDTPAYFDGGDPNGPWVFYGGNGDHLKAFQLTNGLFNPVPTSQSPTVLSGNYGATPVVSANGTSDGIVWALQNAGSGAILHAYDATNLGVELYNTNQVASDKLNQGVKFTSPIVADGKVFVPTNGQLTIYGLLGPRSAKVGRGGKGTVATQTAAVIALAMAHPAVQPSPVVPSGETAPKPAAAGSPLADTLTAALTAPQATDLRPLHALVATNKLASGSVTDGMDASLIDSLAAQWNSAGVNFGS